MSDLPETPAAHLKRIQANILNIKSDEEYFNDLRNILISAIRDNDSSPDTIKVIAFILMEVPDEFYPDSEWSLYQRVIDFIASLSDVDKIKFSDACMNLERYNKTRVDTYLGYY